MFSLTQQLRNTQRANKNFRNQIMDMQTRIHDIEHARNCAEFKLKMFQGSAVPPPSAPVHRRSCSDVYQDNPDLFLVRGKFRSERVYPDRGACTQCVYYNSTFMEWSISPHPSIHASAAAAVDTADTAAATVGVVGASSLVDNAA
ncbi:hypothetical protein K438DRAFT_1983647 [Mycena galopus ATCC 62051]|nr:hypothetical protein K438DRAFT_1983647 [Mycena galopus ATCC 62051]